MVAVRSCALARLYLNIGSANAASSEYNVDLDPQTADFGGHAVSRPFGCVIPPLHRWL